MPDRAKVLASWKTIKIAHVVEVYLRELKLLIYELVLMIVT